MAKIYVSAGHGGRQPGACANGYVEKNYTVQIANALSRLLRTFGHTVMQNRTTDIDKTIESAVTQANDSNCDFFIDIHLNSGRGTGCEAYFSRTGGIGKTVAENICKSIASLGYKNRGARTKTGLFGRDYYEVIRDTRMAAVLCECCFLNNPEDMALLDIDLMAGNICMAILKTFPALVSPTFPAKIFHVQIGSFRDRASAEGLADQLKEKGYAAIIV